MSTCVRGQRLGPGVMVVTAFVVALAPGRTLAQADELPFTPSLQEVYERPPIAGDPLPVVGLLADRSLGGSPDALNVILLLPTGSSPKPPADKACVLVRSRDARLVVRGELKLPSALPARSRSLQLKGELNDKVRKYLATLRWDDLSLRVVLGACTGLLAKGELPTLLAVDPAPRSSPPATGLRLLLNVASPQVQWRYVPATGRPAAWQDCTPGALPGNGAFNVDCRLALPPGDIARLDIARPRDYQEPEVTSIRVVVGGP